MARTVEKAIIAMAAVLTWPGISLAQDSSGQDLMALDTTGLRGAISQRYDAALALTTDQTVIAANTARYMWASQAKNQCGITLGFLKSGTRDPVSIEKCADAAARMAGVQVAEAPIPAPPAYDCKVSPFIVFFDWDRSDITPEAAQTLDTAVSANKACQNAPMNVAGYTDLSGSDLYNQGLSQRRADAVRSYLTGQGVSAASISTEAFGESNPRVPTADGVREVQNRRAEVTFR